MQLGSSLRRRRRKRDDPPDDGGEDRPTWLRTAGLGALAALAGLGLGYLFATWVLFPPPPPPGDLYEVPDVQGLDLDGAAARLDEAGLSLGTVEFLRHPRADSGTVVGQAPVAGQLATPDAPVRVTLSQGSERQPVPDLLGLRGDWAANVLHATGFEVSVDSVEAQDPRGRVLEIDPAPGTELALPGEVVLRVSKGPARVAMPSLVGMEEAAARDTLGVLGLVIGRVDEIFRFGRDQGVVVEQAPPADTLVDRGSAVRIGIGRRGRNGEPPDTAGNKNPRQP